MTTDNIYCNVYCMLSLKYCVNKPYRGHFELYFLTPPILYYYILIYYYIRNSPHSLIFVWICKFQKHLLQFQIIQFFVNRPTDSLSSSFSLASSVCLILCYLWRALSVNDHDISFFIFGRFFPAFFNSCSPFHAPRAVYPVWKTGS